MATDRRKLKWLWALMANALLLILGIAQFMQWWQRQAAPAVPAVRATPTVAPPSVRSSEQPISLPSASPLVTGAPAAGVSPAGNVPPVLTPTLVVAVPPLGEEPQETTASVPVGLPRLIIPVAGIRADQLRDTFSDARSEGRVHNAIDIMAPRDTPVLAAADGELVRAFTSEKGGLTLYQLSTDRKFVFYYAHLSRYLDGIKAGDPLSRRVKQGETIGYVGDTGNATPGNYHLHFAIWQVTDPKRYWNGTNFNPYPLLKPAANNASDSNRRLRP